MAAITPRVAISGVFAIHGAALGGWLAHLPDVQAHLRLTKGELGTTLLFSSVGALLAMTVTGRIVARRGSRRVTTVGAILMLAIVPTLVLMPTPTALACALVVLGAANGVTDIAMNDKAVAVQATLPRPILSSVHGWWGVGGFVGGMGTALANRIGLAPVGHVALASLLLLAALGLVASGLLPDEGKGGEGEAPFAVPRGVLLRLGLLALLAMFAEGTLLDWSAVYFRDELGATRALAALGFGAGSGALAVGRLLGDGVVARLGRPGALRLSGALTGAGLLLAAALPSAAGAFVGFALAGLGLANAVPVLFAAAAEAPGVSSSAGLAAVASLGYAAFLGGPPLVGHVAQATSLRVGLALVGVLSLLLGLLGPRAVAVPVSEAPRP